MIYIQTSHNQQIKKYFDRNFLKTPVSFVIFLSLLLPISAFAENATLDGKSFIFSTGWRSDSVNPENVLQLGIIYPCSQGWCADVEEYLGHLNVSRQKLPYRHGMGKDTNAKGCTDEYMTTIRGTRMKELTVELQKTDNSYVMEIGRYRYKWISEAKNSVGFVLQEIAETTLGDAQFSQPEGFAYWSEGIRDSDFERNQFNAFFHGNIAHKDTLTGVSADWKLSSTSLDVRKFHDSVDSSPAIGLTVAGKPEVLKRMKTAISAYHSILPPLKLDGDHFPIFNHEYGHDFNANGCFDEFGHNKLMLPVLKNDLIQAFVFVEYTHDKLDGVPMISVGRYYR